MYESQFVYTENYKVLIIENKDLTKSSNDTVLFRSTISIPENKFQNGFSKKEPNLNFDEKTLEKISEEQIKDANGLFLRKNVKTGEIDIGGGISGSIKVTTTPYFPTKGRKDEIQKARYLYAIYVPEYYEAYKYEKEQNSFGAAGFDEIIFGNNIKPEHVIAAIRCECVIDKYGIFSYRVVGNIIWNSESNKETVPNYEARVEIIKKEFSKLQQFDFLRIIQEEKTVKTKGMKSVGNFRKNIYTAIDKHSKEIQNPESILDFIKVFENHTESTIQEYLEKTLMPYMNQTLSSVPAVTSFILALEKHINDYKKLKLEEQENSKNNHNKSSVSNKLLLN